MADPYSQLPGTMVAGAPEQDPWQQAFGAYKQALVDLDGDGIPDGVRSQNGQVEPLNNRMRQSISRQAMAGREPTVDMGAIGRRAQAGEENNQSVERGVGELLFGQPIRAGMAINRAYDDPSISSVTNAGAQTALAAFRPLMAGKIALGGLGAAAASDAGLGDYLVGTANAGRGDRDRARLMRDTAAAAKAKAESEAAILRARTEADRQAAELAVKKAEEAEYRTSVDKAEAGKNEILSQRPKRFNETQVGKVYDELGMIAPGVIAAGMGGLTRAGLAASGITGKAAEYAAPMAVGAATGGLAAQWPLGHELLFAPAANPDRRAFDFYARELPPTHPRKNEMLAYAASLPAENPDRKAASEEFYDPVKFGERAAIGVGEGLLGGLAGAEAVNIAGAVGRSLTRPFRRQGRGEGGGTAGGSNSVAGPEVPPSNVPPGPLANTQGMYPQPGSAGREFLRDEYKTSYTPNLSLPTPAAFNRAAQDSAAAQGGSLPRLNSRVKETNAAVNQFISDNGRPPVSNADWARIFRATGTLAVPAAVAAGPLNDMLAGYLGQQ